MKPIAIVVISILVVGLGYAAYTYVKQDPPDALVSLVAEQEKKPLPVAEGEPAPLTVAAGFSTTVFADDLPGVRVLTRDPKGVLIASLTSQGKIVALPDLDSNGVVDEIKTVVQGLNKPHGMVFVCGDTGSVSADQDGCRLFVAETDSLKSWSYDADTYTVNGEQTHADLPTQGGGHYTRTLMLHPDGTQLLISVGSSCNVCEERDSRRATVLSYDLETKELSPFATGVRNTVFMATDSVTGEVWGTDNGRDVIGDDIPPDEINIITQGRDYGWPYCYGQQVFDTDFNQRGKDYCSRTQASHIDLQAHSAALGLAFVPEEGYPEDMRNDLLIAYHGSWNRKEPTGYKVVRFDLEPSGERKARGGPIDFLTGFLEEGQDEDEAIGRPVAVLAEPGGVIHISDDKAGVIYRVVKTTE